MVQIIKGFSMKYLYSLADGMTWQKWHITYWVDNLSPVRGRFVINNVRAIFYAFFKIGTNRISYICRWFLHMCQPGSQSDRQTLIESQFLVNSCNLNNKRRNVDLFFLGTQTVEYSFGQTAAKKPSFFMSFVTVKMNIYLTPPCVSLLSQLLTSPRAGHCTCVTFVAWGCIGLPIFYGWSPNSLFYL